MKKRALAGRPGFTKAYVCVVIAALFFVIWCPGTAGAQDKSGKSTPRLVDVGADKCIPCIMMAPVLDELKKEYAGILDVEFVDVWKNPEAGRRYKVRGIPTQIFYDSSGQERYRHMGYYSKAQILQKFSDLGIVLTKDEKKGKLKK